MAVFLITVAVWLSGIAAIWWYIQPAKCLDCQHRNMREFACPYNEGYCVWCCYCPDHEGEMV